MILKHIRNYFLSNIIVKIAGLISIPIFTHFLTPSEYGKYQLFISLVDLVAVLLTLNLFSSASRYYYEESKDFNKFFTMLILFILLIFVFNSSIFYYFVTQISSDINIDVEILKLVPMASFFYIGITMLIEILQAQEKSSLLAKVNIYRAYIALFVSVGLVWYLQDNKYYGIIYGQIIVMFIIFIYSLYYFKNYINNYITFNKKYFQYSIYYSLPLLPAALSGFILNKIDLFMINGMSSVQEAGLYSFSYSVGMLIWIPIAAIQQAWLPRYFKFMNNKEYIKHDAEIYLYLKIITFIASVFILFSNDIAILLSTDEYKSAFKIIPIIIVGYVFLAFFEVYKRNIIYKKRTIYISVIALSAGIINSILNYYFIPIYGYIASAYTTLFSFIYMFILSYIINKYLLGMHVILLNRFLFNIFILLTIVVIYYKVNLGYIYTSILVILLVLVFFISEIQQFYKIKSKGRK